MAVSGADLEELLAAVDRGRQSWIDGALGYGDGLDVAHDDGMTIVGLFGGGPGLQDRQQQAARLFHGGTGACEVVKTIVSGDVVVIVLIERNEAVVEGSEGATAVGSANDAGLREAPGGVGPPSPAR